jgi:hypothetical protein
MTLLTETQRQSARQWIEGGMILPPQNGHKSVFEVSDDD